LRNPFPLIWLPWKRAAKLTVFLENRFKKMMWIWLAAPKHSRCIHDTLHLGCHLKSSPVQSCRDLPYGLASMEGKTNSSMLHDLMDLSLIK
jgi:hypothetical protein